MALLSRFRLAALLLATLAWANSGNAQNYSSNWQPLGPLNMPSFEPSMGRVNCIVSPPGNPNQLYLGAAGGGVWSSGNGGVTWFPRSDSLPVLGVSGLVIDYSNTNNIYLATGDADGENTPSVGVYKSTDAGITWNPTGLNFPLSTSSYPRIYKLIMHPTNPQWLYAATSQGVYITYNGGTS